MRIIAYPPSGLNGDGFPVHSITLPDKWTGKDKERYDTAVADCEKSNVNPSYQDFFVAVALLTNWNMPHMIGNPTQWDYDDIDLGVMGFITHMVLVDYHACFDIKKNFSNPFFLGWKKTAKKRQAPNTSKIPNDSPLSVT